MIKSFERIKKQNKERIKVPRTVQDTIPVDTIYKDGIFRMGNKYSKSYRFLDINYKIASGEDKNNLFLSYSDLLNSFDSSVMTKITINNRKIDLKKFKDDILIPMKDDGLDVYRQEYNDMLLQKLAESDDIIQEKYITVTVFKSNIDEARFTFSRITSEFTTLFSRLGSACIELDAEERLKILHDFYRNENDELVYDGNDLGAVYTKEKTTFRIWTPAAGKVSLNLYEQGDGDNLIETIPMTADVKGTWVYEKTGDLNGVYYTYSVQIGNKVNEVVDLYARSAGVNGNRGEILDLQAADPDGFDSDVRPAFNNATDAVIYEVHIRDLSSDASSGIRNTGKFLGLTERGTKNREGLATGLDHILDLGVTHVQILPSCDYATVDETKPDTAQFNWGYDPKNYNVPEGSYSTDPYHGEVRVNEMKQMIKTLHENGIREIGRASCRERV